MLCAYSAEILFLISRLSRSAERSKRIFTGGIVTEAAAAVVASTLHVRCGSVFLVMANQEREKQGLPNPVAHDTDMAIRVAVEAIRKLIKEDNE